MDEYSDIMHLTRPKSKRSKMDIIQRANIFNPFAALTGYQESINEAGRIVDKKIELDNDHLVSLDNKINELLQDNNKKVIIIYYIKDKTKDGGEYKSITGFVEKININDKILICDKIKIKFNDLYSINYVL